MAKAETIYTKIEQVRVPQMTVEQAKAELVAELKKGDESISNGNFLSLQESKAMLGL